MELRIKILALMAVILLLPLTSAEQQETADSENIQTGNLENGDVTDTRTDDGVVKNISEANVGTQITPDYQLNASEYFTTGISSISRLELVTNAWTKDYNGGGDENMSYYIYNYSDSSYVDTGINAEPDAASKTFTASICLSGCNITGDPDDFVNSTGFIETQYLDDQSDSSQNNLLIDYQAVNLTETGSLSLFYHDPANDTVVTQNKTFLVNATVECSGGECGEVNASTRYNESSTADTLIPENSGKPFFTVGSNSKRCSSDLGRNENCTVTWDVNATGKLESYHLVDVNASSSFSKVSDKDTEDRLVQINMAVLINLSWSRTDFGLLDIGAENKSAVGNYNLSYNVSVLEESNSVDNLWLKSTDLKSEKEPDNYSIGADNMSYSLQNDSSTSEEFSNNYTVLESDISPGSVLNTFYWIDIPRGILNGEYNGTFSFKANSTR